MADSVLIVFLINCIDYNGLYTSLMELLTGLASILFYYNITKGSKRRQVYPGKRKGLFCILLVNMGTYEVNFRRILLAICYSMSNSGFAWVAIWWFCFLLLITGQYFIFSCCLGIGWVGVARDKFLAQHCLHLCSVGIPLWGWGPPWLCQVSWGHRGQLWPRALGTFLCHQVLLVPSGLSLLLL